jgi:hypothetical protein
MNPSLLHIPIFRCARHPHQAAEIVTLHFHPKTVQCSRAGVLGGSTCPGTGIQPHGRTGVHPVQPRLKLASRDGRIVRKFQNSHSQRSNQSLVKTPGTVASLGADSQGELVNHHHGATPRRSVRFIQIQPSTPAFLEPCR